MITKQLVLVHVAVLALAAALGTPYARASDQEDGGVRFDSTMVAMSDGVRLLTDTYLPAGNGPFPVILIRTPYSARQRSFLGEGFAGNGFAVVLQNVRGQNGSEGQFVPFVHERQDGLDTADWIKKQPWCNGKIGLWGASYHGFAAFEVAMTGHPAVGAVYHISGYSDLGDFMAHGGAFQLQAHLRWYYSYAAKQPNPPDEVWAGIFRTTPLSQFFQGAEGVLDLASMEYDYSRIQVPVMHVTGWYDYIYPNVLQTHDAIEKEGNVSEQRLVLGPWSHNGVLNSWTTVGEEDFGKTASAGMEWGIEHASQWFDYVLNGKTNELSKSHPVRFFVMNDNAWLEDTAWPPSKAEYQKWYIGDGGSLSLEEPKNQGQLQFVYDPNDPVPTLGGANSHFFPGNLGPKDQSELAQRADVLSFASAPLKDKVIVAGPIKATVYASTSGLDTDFTAKLCVIRRDGYVRNIEDGIVRARYLFEGSDSAGYVTPGQVRKYEIDCGATALALFPGERLALHISSSNFPKYDRNPNSGVDPFYASELLPATQTVFYSPEHPTHISIPVLASP